MRRCLASPWPRCPLLAAAFAVLTAACSSSSGAGGHDGGRDAPSAGDAGRHDASDGGKASHADTGGSCSPACRSGATCDDGLCSVVLATGQGAAPNAVTDLAVDDARVYWMPAGSEAGSVVSVPKAGGAVSTLASGIAQPMGLTLGSSQVFFVSFMVGIETVAKTGGTPTFLLKDGTLDAGVFPETWLVYSPPQLFFLGDPMQSIFAISPDGGLPVSVAPTVSLLGAPGPGYNALAVDDGGIYYDTTSAIVRLSRSSFVAEGQAPGGSASGATVFGPTIAIDDQFLYFIKNRIYDGGIASTLMKVAKDSDGGGAATPLTSDDVASEDGPIAVDASYVYWSHRLAAGSGTSVVEALPLAGGGAPKVVTTSCGGPCPFVLDSTSIYWPGADGSIRSSLKPD